MKSLTEFHTHKLEKGLNTKKTLAAEGKSSEEVLAGIGEAFKIEGDKLKYFTNAMEVASQNMEKLARILVVSYNEGEIVAPKAVKIEEHYYIPEFQNSGAAPTQGKTAKSITAVQKKGKKQDRKSSPWGDAPEEKSAKKSANAAPKAEKPEAN